MPTTEVRYNTEFCPAMVELDGETYPVPEAVKPTHAKNAARFSRPGTKTWLALAMCMTPKGATAAQIKAINGQMYENRMIALEKEGQLELARSKGHCPLTDQSDRVVYKARLPKRTKQD